MRIDAHHHLWDLKAVDYPWLMEKGKGRFFGDPTPIQRNYLIDEFINDASVQGFKGSVHIQVGARNGLEEAKWVQSVAESNPHWPMMQVAFCDLTANDFYQSFEKLKALSTLRGVRQIIGRAEEEDQQTGTNAILDNPKFVENLKILAKYDVSFDLQLTPSLIRQATEIFAKVPNLKVALCHAGSPHPRDETSIQKWAANMKIFAQLSNSYCKLSGLGMFDHHWEIDSFRPLVDGVLDAFSPARTMFGSNFPVDSISSNYKKLVQSYEFILSPLGEFTSEQIFGQTAFDFYRF
jgi:predicted TIM-barrel fold metal-dependent hydrolase